MQTPFPSSSLPIRLPARVWRLLTHPALTAVLAVLLLLAAMAFWQLPQAPATVAVDATAYAEWLEKTAGSLTGGRVLAALGLLNVEHSILVRVFLALFVAVLVLRLLDRIHLSLTSRALAAPARALPGLLSSETEVPLTAPAGDWQRVLEGIFTRHSCEHDHNDRGLARWVGDRNHSYILMFVLIELALILGAAAFVLALRYGWQMEDIELLPGRSQNLAPYSEAQLGLDEAAENLVICCGTEGRVPLRPGRLGTAGLDIYVQELLPALQVNARLDAQPLPLQSIEQGGGATANLLLRFPQERSERTVAIPQRNLLLRVVQLDTTTYRVQALDSEDSLLLSRDLGTATTVQIEDVELTLQPTHTARVRVVARPWLWLLIPAFLLVSVGLALRWRFAYVRLGVLATPEHLALRWQGQSLARPLPEQLAALLATPPPPGS